MLVHMGLLIAVVSIPFITSCAGIDAKPKNIFFEGKKIFDEDTRFLIRPSDKGDAVFVHSPHHDFVVILPYSESWVIRTGSRGEYVASDSKTGIVVSLMIKISLRRGKGDGHN